jgi:hypothetical protein
MKIIEKRFNDNINNTSHIWDYSEEFMINGVLYRRYNIINSCYSVNFKWELINNNSIFISSCNDYDQLEFENEYNKLKRKEKLNNILNENY